MVYRRNLPLEFVIREFPIKILPEFLGFIFKFFFTWNGVKILCILILSQIGQFVWELQEV